MSQISFIKNASGKCLELKIKNNSQKVSQKIKNNLQKISPKNKIDIQKQSSQSKTSKGKVSTKIKDVTITKKLSSDTFPLQKIKTPQPDIFTTPDVSKIPFTKKSKDQKKEHTLNISKETPNTTTAHLTLKENNTLNLITDLSSSKYVPQKEEDNIANIKEEVKSKRLQARLETRLEAKELEDADMKKPSGRWSKIQELVSNELPEKSLYAAGKMWSNEDLDLFLEQVSKQTNVPAVNSLFLYKATRSPQTALDMLSGFKGETRFIIPLWIRAHWLLAGVDRSTKTVDLMDSETGLVSVSELKEVASFISSGLGEELTPRILRSLLQENNSTDCGLFTAINSILWCRGMLPQRKQHHVNRRISPGNMLPLAEMFATGGITMAQLLERFLSHIATIEAPLLAREDVLSRMDEFAEKNLRFIKVGWIGYKEDSPTLIEWSGVLIKRHQKTWKVQFEENEAAVWIPKQDYSYVYIVPDEDATIADTQADRLSLKEAVPFNPAQVEGDEITCAQVIALLEKAESHVTPVEQAMAYTTRTKHKAALASLRLFPPRYHQLSLTVAIATYVIDTRKARKWRHSTALTTLATFQGALRLAPIYFRNVPSITIKNSLFWKLAMRAALHNSVAEVPDQPLAVKAEEVGLLMKASAPLDPPYHALPPLLEISWMTAARVGDALLLAPSDISFAKATNEEGAWQMNVRFRRGKTARRGQYVIAQPMPSADTREYVLKAQRENQYWLFPGLETSHMTAFLRTVNPALESRSIRRGRLQHLSKLGCTDAELLHVSRHANIPMLRRYLSFGVDSGENSRRAFRIEKLEQQFNEQQKQPLVSFEGQQQILPAPKWSNELSHSWETGSGDSSGSMSSM